LLLDPHGQEEQSLEGQFPYVYIKLENIQLNMQAKQCAETYTTSVQWGSNVIAWIKSTTKGGLNEESNHDA
jgi:hypothetical protein